MSGRPRPAGPHAEPAAVQPRPGPGRPLARGAAPRPARAASRRPGRCGVAPKPGPGRLTPRPGPALTFKRLDVAMISPRGASPPTAAPLPGLDSARLSPGRRRFTWPRAARPPGPTRGGGSSSGRGSGFPCPEARPAPCSGRSAARPAGSSARSRPSEPHGGVRPGGARQQPRLHGRGRPT